MGRETETAGASERDFAAELDDRMRLRQLFEGLRGRLDAREREAATLCYLQGLSRAEAAERMGVSERRMRKLMEGHGPGRPGVAGKVGALVETIRDGAWCAEQGSLMRALAYGILDPDGERHRLALAHHGQCPACRAYVASLRGLAATLPPVLLPWGLGAAALAHAGEGLHAAAAGGGAGGAAARRVGLARRWGGRRRSERWRAGRPRARRRIVGVWRDGRGRRSRRRLAVRGGPARREARGRMPARAGRGRWLCGARGRPCARSSPRPTPCIRVSTPVLARATADQLNDPAGVGQPLAAVAPGSAGSARPLTSSARASREFGPEQALASGAGGASASVSDHASVARSASSRLWVLGGGGSVVERLVVGWRRSADLGGAGSPRHSSAGDSSAAEREFTPG